MTVLNEKQNLYDSGTVVKICGVRTVEAAVAAAEAGADIIGMIFAPSPRLIDTPTAQKIAQAVCKYHRVSDSNELVRSNTASHGVFARISREAAPKEFFASCCKQILGRGRPLLAGVFQNQPLEHIIDIARSVPLDLVQLHGMEPASMAEQIPVPVIKVFHVDESFSLENEANSGDLLRTFSHSMILLDTKVGGTTQQGGRGVSFDWGIARRLADMGVPFLMAGGLTPDNVAEALEVGRPWGVDVSSGVETEKVKDPEKIRAFVNRAKK
ncbi:PRAI-domain-containing protein [Coemansia reversa NRRL 1564]|uniref:N-(5'-phosphoribosyl)anthranilate isomerase n=1 Tax=Coemansia reversa (strain ATCC 12441 / NRRL 1564) TaxID=763665 RepID=A0A2G5B2X5_COERN|nr:PRAI-domain-containing protein [Coemansia reversa NRRL 1564]|eukprot:PIA13379.1 PRAI-domain-containing protein [Coemansia reversa NRRL 1564]